MLVQLEGSGAAVLEATWETRDGETHSKRESVTIPADSHHETTAIRTAVLLAREADLLTNWTIHEQADLEVSRGIEPPDERYLGRWERTAAELTVTDPHPERLGAFREHLETEVAAIGDADLEQELDMFTTIFAAAGASTGAGETTVDARVSSD